MRVDISIPQIDQDSFDAAGLKDYLARCEQLGFTGGWVMEQAVGPTPMLAPLELLAYCSACTTRLRLGVAVLVATQHEPLQLAAAVTAVDRLSHGRLDVGVSPGGGFRKFEAFGVDRATFIRWFLEELELMKAAWSDDERVTFEGRFRTVANLPIQPKPVQRPHPPIWFGANAPRALARAVRHGDAFLGAGSATTAAFAEQVRVLRRELDAQHKDPTGFPIGKRVYLAVDDDREHARRLVMDGLHQIYGRMKGIEDVPVFGTAADVARGLERVRAAGAEMIVLNPVGATVSEHRTQLERLAADVLPQLT